MKNALYTSPTHVQGISILDFSFFDGKQWNVENLNISNLQCILFLKKV